MVITWGYDKEGPGNCRVVDMKFLFYEMKRISGSQMLSTVNLLLNYAFQND